MKNKNKIIGFVLFCILILFLVLIYDLLKWIFGKFITKLICFLSVYSFFRFIAVVSTFPGAYWFYSRPLVLGFNTDYCLRLNLATERFIKCIQIDLDKGKLSNNKYRLPFSQLTQLIDNIYVFKTLLDQHVSIYKRMSECNNLSGTQLQFQRMLEDARRSIKHKV